jgi:hypothetical protein
VVHTRKLLLITIGLAASGCVVANPAPPADPLRVQVRVTVCADNPVCANYPHVHAGTLIYLEADTLLMYAEDQLVRLPIPVAHIAKLEVYRGRKPSVAGAAKGAGVGALMGAAIGAAAAGVSGAVFGGIADVDVGEMAARGAIEGVVGGAITGAAVGASVGSPVWQEVSVRQLREELCHCRIEEPPVS